MKYSSYPFIGLLFFAGMPLWAAQSLSLAEGDQFERKKEVAQAISSSGKKLLPPLFQPHQPTNQPQKLERSALHKRRKPLLVENFGSIAQDLDDVGKFPRRLNKIILGYLGIHEKLTPVVVHREPNLSGVHEKAQDMENLFITLKENARILDYEQFKKYFSNLVFMWPQPAKGDGGLQERFRHYRQYCDIQGLQQSDNLLTFAARNGYTELVRNLLADNVDPDCSSADGITALMQTCGTWQFKPEHEKIIKLLCAAGASINMRDKGGNTALMYACGQFREGCLDSDAIIQRINFLLDAGAVSTLMNSDGIMAWQIHWDWKTRDYLKEFMFGDSKLDKLVPLTTQERTLQQQIRARKRYYKQEAQQLAHRYDEDSSARAAHYEQEAERLTRHYDEETRRITRIYEEAERKAKKEEEDKKRWDDHLKRVADLASHDERNRPAIEYYEKQKYWLADGQQKQACGDALKKIFKDLRGNGTYYTVEDFDRMDQPLVDINVLHKDYDEAVVNTVRRLGKKFAENILEKVIKREKEEARKLTDEIRSYLIAHKVVQSVLR